MITLIAAFITGVFSVLVAWIAHAYKHQGPTDPLVNRCQKIQEFHEEYMLKSHPLFIRNSRAKALVGSLLPNFYEVAYLFHKPLFENLAIELAKFRWFFIFEFENNGFIKKIKLDKTKVLVISFLSIISYIVLVGFALYGLDGQNGTIAEVKLLYSNSKYISIFNIFAAKTTALIVGIVALLYGIKLISLLATGKEIES